MVNNLQIYIQAAQVRNESLDHLLFSGPPGLGKTTLAKIISKVQKGNFHQMAAPNIKRTGDIVKLLTNIDKHDVLFIDEIHRLPAPVEEILYSAMEDNTIDITLSDVTSASAIQLELPCFTLIGATTRAGALSAPLRDRFGIQLTLSYYTIDELKQILARTAKIWYIKISDQALDVIAQRSRKTPRVAIRLLRRIWDYALVYQEASKKDSVTSISLDIVEQSFEGMKIDSLGLTELDRSFLTTMSVHYDGGPVGLRPISAIVSEDELTLEDFIEPFLVRLGFVKRTSRGRVLTNAAIKHLKLDQLSKHRQHETLF